MVGKNWHDGYFLLSAGRYFHNQLGLLFPLPEGSIVDILEADVADAWGNHCGEVPSS